MKSCFRDWLEKAGQRLSVVDVGASYSPDKRDVYQSLLVFDEKLLSVVGFEPNKDLRQAREVDTVRGGCLSSSHTFWGTAQEGSFSIVKTL